MCSARSESLSRLKGIETVWMKLQTRSHHRCSESLSRLKGIETILK